MFDPLTLTAFASLFGAAAGAILKKAAESRAEAWVGKLFDRAEGMVKKDVIEEAIERATGYCLDSIVASLKGHGYDDEDLAVYKPGLEALIQDEAVAREIERPLLEADWTEPDPAVFREAWSRLEARPLPSEFQWPQALQGFKRQVAKERVVPPDLREQLKALDLAAIREGLRVVAGVQPAYDRQRYAARMREKYREVELSAVERPGDEPNRLLLVQVFLPQDVREDPPKAELPRDLLRWLEGKRDKEGREVPEPEQEHVRRELERAREIYDRQPRQPVLDMLGRPDCARVVLLGDPGAGKSALTRFLLLTLLEPIADGPSTGSPAWAAPLAGHLPLLVEIKDFLARRGPGCETFVEYLHALGKTEGYHLEQLELDKCLQQEPTVVLFDGLDEVFDPGERKRIAGEIAGFAATYPLARVVVTSRPVGYLEGPLRGAGFRHFALQDFDQEQIRSFVRSWYGLTFPGKPEEATPRIERVLRAIDQSRSVALLAGNPLLLTVMVLLGRQQELPRERAAFYQHAADVLCHHWDVNKHLRTAGIHEYVGIDDKREILRRLAFRMQSADKGLAGNYLREEELSAELEGYFRARYEQRPDEAKSAARAMVSELRERNYVLCLYGPGVYGFVHRTFLEYFCAAELVRRLHEDPEDYPIDWLLQIYGSHWQDAAWQEVLRLICGMTGEKYAGQIIEFLTERQTVDRGDHRVAANLVLATYCLSEVRNRPAVSQAGGKLLQAIVRAAHERRLWDRTFLAMVREIGTSWPGTQQFERAFLAEPFPPQLPNFNRSFIAELAVAVLPRLGKLFEVLTKQLQAPDAASRSAIPAALAVGWSQDDEVRQLLFNAAQNDQESAVRSSALRALASAWNQDDEVRQLLFNAARNDQDPYARWSALQALASGWIQDDEVRQLLFNAAQNDQESAVRRSTLEVLVSGWIQDDEVRQLLFNAARNDQEPIVRSVALHALASGWSQDDEVRQLLFNTARNDQDPDVRRFALQDLASGWSQDAEVRQLLFNAARNDQATGVRSSALQALARDLDPLVRQVLSRDLDAEAPFLDPCSPLSPGHIEKAAARLGLTEQDVRDQIADASRILGLNLFEP
jgi:HEAT repeats/NACHT domain